MPSPYVFKTVELDGLSIRTVVRPGQSTLAPLLIFNGIGAVSYTHLTLPTKRIV